MADAEQNTTNIVVAQTTGLFDRVCDLLPTHPQRQSISIRQRAMLHRFSRLFHVVFKAYKFYPNAVFVFQIAVLFEFKQDVAAARIAVFRFTHRANVDGMYSNLLSRFLYEPLIKKTEIQPLNKPSTRLKIRFQTLTYRLMRKLLLLFLSLPCFSQSDIARWEKQAQNVTIIRDNFGIPHIYGKTDADAVFGLLYAQSEDDFKRVEMNYVEKLGRMAEVKGKDKVYEDLVLRMIIDAGDAQKDYDKAPAWLKNLCNAFADGVNYYLYTHPDVKPALLTRFEPWWPFLWTDGSIGAISTAGVTTEELKNFYSDAPSTSAVPVLLEDDHVTGSNGFAFAPKITASGKAILYINPHVTFYFRPEVHMVSEQGLNVYGAVTWGQFFIYQGFNEHCGWMHTSSGVDAADTYIEKIFKKGDQWVYQYDGKEKPVVSKKITLLAKTTTGFDTTRIDALYTLHGPIMAKREGKWLSLRADNRITNGLIQCWQRTKAKGLDDFQKTLDLKGNISNNTVYADASGNIAYWHGNRIPKRNDKYDWSQPVDGSTSATDWQGYHDVSETVHSINPPNGWLQNCNSTPFNVAGTNSPKKENYPVYMAPDGELFRGINAVRVLEEEKNYTLDKVIKAGYDTRLVAFEMLVPALVEAFESPVFHEDSLHNLLVAPIGNLKQWDFRCSESSVATTLAVEWGQRLWPIILQIQVPGVDKADQVQKTAYFIKSMPSETMLLSFLATVRDLENRYGRWDVP